MVLRPLVAAAGAVLAGTAAGLASPIAPLAAALIAAVASRLGGTRLALAAVAFGIGAANGSLRGALDVYAGPPVAAKFNATVLDVDRSAGAEARFTARLADGRVLEAATRDAAPEAGSRMRMSGRLEAFDGPRNPGEPDGRALAAERGHYARFSRARIASRQAPVLDPITALPLARAWARDRTTESIDEPYASVLAGALWGERGTLPPQLRAEFQETGTMHILVTAGLHVGMIAALIAALAGALGLGRLHASIATAALVWLYAFLSGAHLPSMRAATMTSIALAAFAIGRKPISANTLALAAIAIALVWPASVASVSFALSFSCVGAIALFAEPLERSLERARLPGAVREAIALTLATQLGTWPLTAQTFFVIAPYAPLANAIVVPLTGGALVGGVALLASTPLPVLRTLTAGAESVLLGAIAASVGGIAALPGARLTITPPPAWSIAVYDVAMAGAATLLRRGSTRAAAAVVLVAALTVVAGSSLRASHGALRVRVLDVGQGDGIVVQTPNGSVLLIDTGGRLERGSNASGTSPAERVGERVVVPFLLRAGIRRIDAMLLTHAHGDHVGGCAPILRTIPVDAVIVRPTDYGGFAFRDCLAEARVRHVRISPARRGLTWMSDDGVRFTLLAPFDPPLANTEDDENENSTVVRVEYAGRRILLMGDAGEAAESRLLQSGDDLRADVLKVGHHGSATATTAAFVRAVAPRYAVISVGRDNTFGHPAPETIATLRAAGIEPARTDCDGAVTVAIAGDGSLSVTPFLRRTPDCGLMNSAPKKT